jgi:hypothetical protein
MNDDLEVYLLLLELVCNLAQMEGGSGKAIQACYDKGVPVSVYPAGPQDSVPPN